MSSNEAGSIRVLIVHRPQYSSRIRTYFEYKPRFDIVGVEERGANALAQVVEAQPDVVILDPFLTDVAKIDDLITAIDASGASVIVVSFESILPEVQMLCFNAGAVHVLEGDTASVVDIEKAIIAAYDVVLARRKPNKKSEETVQLAPETMLGSDLPGAEGAGVIFNPFHAEQGKVICFYAPKGGVGATGVAINTALALAEVTQERVALVDMNLQFGELDLILGIPSEGARTITSLLPTHARYEQGSTPAPVNIDEASLLRTLIRGPLGIGVLLAPAAPEDTGRINPGHLVQILRSLRDHYRYVCVNVATSLNDYVTQVLDESDVIITVTIPEFSSVRNTVMFLDYAGNMNFSQEKVQLVLNRSESKADRELSLDDPRTMKGRTFLARISERERAHLALFPDSASYKESEPYRGEYRKLAQALIPATSEEKLRTASGLS